MTNYTIDQVRSLYLDFHKSKGHTIVPSSPLIPKEDPTVLFNTAGMQPMVPFLTGQSKYPDGKSRIANSQICIRTDDVEEVGDNRHCTFFEMLGNWSINDYFKSEIIPWSMEFLTSNKWLGVDANRIYATVYKGYEGENISEDKVSIELWKNEYEKLGIDSNTSTEFDFDEFRKTYPNLNKINSETINYIALDFDGVIANSINAEIDFIFTHREKYGFAGKSKTEIFDFISNHFSKPKGSTDFSLSSFKKEYLNWIIENNIHVKIFKDYVKALAGLKNTRFAIVTDNSIDIVNKILEDNKFNSFGLNIDKILTKEDGQDKIQKLESVSKLWNIDIKNIIYITDTVRDKLELETTIGEKNIYVKFGGFSGDNSILENFNYQNILFKPKDVENILKPKLIDCFSIEEISKLNFITRIRKMSGKDNWWGLPYKGPCGPCSEMYYLLNHNPIDFETSIFPYCTINQIEDFIEDQIVEIGNNVFMMYKGEKNENKEPFNTENLGMQNVDTGLGLERFVMAINGYSSVYEIDTYQSVLQTIDKWSR